jgi:hypothetical protein
MIGAAGVFLLATTAMLLQIDPFFSWYYTCAWWPYIVFVEALIRHRGGHSPLFENPRGFLGLSLLSLNVWLLFEVFNFRLHNWHYILVPEQTAVRWLGYAVSFATVLPGLFATMRLLEMLGVVRNGQVAQLATPERFYRPFVAGGVVFLLLPIIWPRFFFPLVWVGWILLLEPFNHRHGAPSLLRDWQRGSLRRFVLLLIAGGCCGLLWELWNFWAGAKWVYTIPYVAWLKIFEMPLLGFLGFPPFAVECYVMIESVKLVQRKIDQRLTRRQALAFRAIMTIVVLLADCAAVWGIDRVTVVSYRSG